MKPSPVLCALSIAGSDSGGGAGVQADARVMRLFGVHACTAITAVTAQNTTGVFGVELVSTKLIRLQARACLSDMPVRAVKTGLLPSAAAVMAVAGVLEGFPDMPLVVDPVLASSSGTRFLDERGRRALVKRLLPRASLVTPNWPELALLSGRTVGDARESIEAGLALVGCHGCAVLVKGGHSGTRRCDDVLLLPDGGRRVFRGLRLRTTNDHGTGCSLSAGITAGLAMGLGLGGAIEAARQVLRAGLRENADRSWGAGAGPAVP